MSTCFCVCFVQKMSSEPMNPLLPNLLWWCIIMGWNVMQKYWVAVFKVMVTVKVHNHILKSTWLFYYIFWTNLSFATKLTIMVDHCKPKSPVKILDYCGLGQGHNENSNFQLMFGWRLLNYWTFCRQTLFDGTST